MQKQTVIRALSVLPFLWYAVISIIPWLSDARDVLFGNPRYMIMSTVVPFLLYGTYPLAAMIVLWHRRSKGVYITMLIIGAALLTLNVCYNLFAAVMWGAIGAVGNGETALSLEEQLSIIFDLFRMCVPGLLGKSTGILSAMVLYLISVFSKPHVAAREDEETSL